MRFIVSLMLMLTSCGRADYTWPALVRLVPNTNPILAAETIQSIQALNRFVGEDIIKFNVDASTVTAYDIVLKFTDKEDGKRAGVAVIYDHVCYVTVFPLAVKFGLIRTVLWHELAHCAGVMHVPGKVDIMSESVNQFEYYSADRLEFFKNQLLTKLKGKMR